MERNIPNEGYRWNSVEVDGERLKELVAACRAAKVPYRLGGKAHSLTAKPADFVSGIDCSGFVRLAVFQASGGAVRMPDGSWHQGEWLADNGFKSSTRAACALKDGRVRVAVMSAKDGGGVGHIALVYDGRTYESHGGVGPNSRPWTGKGWQAKARVWVLDALPEEDEAPAPVPKKAPARPAAAPAASPVAKPAPRPVAAPVVA